jgi:hypothetical protein
LSVQRNDALPLPDRLPDSLLLLPVDLVRNAEVLELPKVHVPHHQRALRVILTNYADLP